MRRLVTSQSQPARPDERVYLLLRWVVRGRWLCMLLFALLVIGLWAFGYSEAQQLMFVVFALGALTTLGGEVLLRRRRLSARQVKHMALGIALIDSIVITLTIHATGGGSSMLFVLYLLALLLNALFLPVEALLASGLVYCVLYDVMLLLVGTGVWPTTIRSVYVGERGPYTLGGSMVVQMVLINVVVLITVLLLFYAEWLRRSLQRRADVADALALARQNQLAQLNEIGRTLSSTLDVGEVLARLWSVLSDIVVARRAEVWLGSPDRLRFLGSHVWSSNDAPVQSLDLGMHQRQRIADRAALVLPEADAPTRWFAVTPLLFGDEVLGVLVLRRVDHSAALWLEPSVLRSLGAILGNALANARHFADQQQQLRQQAALAAFAELAAASSSDDEVVNAVQLTARQLFPQQHVNLRLLNTLGDQLVCRTPDPMQLDCTTLPAATCWALRRGQTTLIEPDGLVCTGCVLPNRTSVCVPLLHRGEALGVIEIAYAATDDGVRGLPAVLEAWGHHVALALASVRSLEQLRHQALRDPLTNLHNRRYLDDCLHHTLPQALEQQQLLAVLLLDLDFFKQVNDRWGHAEGDHVLQQFAQLLRSMVRTTDLVGRQGGEEFVMVLPHTDSDGALVVAEAIRVATEQLRIPAPDRSMIGVTVSIGIALAPSDGETFGELLRHADEALYRAKDAGRNCVVVFQGAMAV